MSQTLAQPIPAIPNPGHNSIPAKKYGQCFIYTCANIKLAFKVINADLVLVLQLAGKIKSGRGIGNSLPNIRFMSYGTFKKNYITVNIKSDIFFILAPEDFLAHYKAIKNSIEQTANIIIK